MAGEATLKTYTHFQVTVNSTMTLKTHMEAKVPKLLTSDENSVSRSLSTPVTYCEL